MKKLLLATILSLTGCVEPTQVTCIDSTNKVVSCPEKHTPTPEEQTKSRYVTTIEGCKIYYITTPVGYKNIYLSKCESGESSAQYTRDDKSGDQISNVTSMTPPKKEDNVSKTPSLTNLVETEQLRARAISKLTLEERKLLLDSADAVKQLQTEQ